MGYCLNSKFKSELHAAFTGSYHIALNAERVHTKNLEVEIPRQLELAQLVAKMINEGYYHRLPFDWIPYICVNLAEMVNGETVLAIEIVGLHKAGFGLWN